MSLPKIKINDKNKAIKNFWQCVNKPKIDVKFQPKDAAKHSLDFQIASVK